MITLFKYKFALSDAQLLVLLDALTAGRRRVYFVDALLYLLSDFVQEDKFTNKPGGYFVGAVARGLYDAGKINDVESYIQWGKHE